MTKSSLAIVSFLAIALSALVATPQPVLAQGSGNKKFIPGEAIVVLQPGASIDAVNAEYGTTVIDVVNESYLLKLPSDNGTGGVVRDMRADPNVWWASPNLLVASPNSRRARQLPTQTFPHDEADGFTPDRAGYDSQPFLTNLNIHTMGSLAQGDGIVIAVIDTGVDLEHPDLAGHFAHDATGAVIGLDLINGGTPQEERIGDTRADNSAFGHGTFIAGLIAKVAPKARIIPIRALGPDGVGESFDIVRAVAFAVEHGAHVINMSFGAPNKIDGLTKELADARDQAILVAATGNFNNDAKQFPAEESFVTAVSAVDDNNVKANFSNYGSDVDVSAPGEGLVSTYPAGQYATWSGTSFAAPIVSATAALVLSRQLGRGQLDVDCAAETLVETGRLLDTVPRNRPYRGKLGTLVDPVAAVTSNGCGDAYSRIDLFPTDSRDRKLSGEAEVRLDNGREAFELEAREIKASSGVSLRLTMLGGATYTQPLAVSGGRVRLELDSESGTLPPELSPVTAINLVEVLRGGAPILRGRFANAGNPGGGDDDGGDDDGGGGDDGGGDDDGGSGGGDDDGGGDGSGGDGGGGGDTQAEEEISLIASGVDADATGSARWRVDGERQRFDVEAYALDPSATYELWVDGVLVGSFVTDAGGNGEIDFDSDNGPIPGALDPVSEIGLVQIRNAAGVILSGSF